MGSQGERGEGKRGIMTYGTVWVQSTNEFSLQLVLSSSINVLITYNKNG